MYLCCGDSLFDLFVGDDTSAIGAQGGIGRITLSGGIGGSPLNVAAGLKRLGHHSRYFVALSNDLFGQRQRHWFEREGVDTSLCVETDRYTTLAVVQLDQGGAAQYAFYTNGTADTGLTTDDLPDQLPDDIRVLHFGSYCTALRPTADAFLAFARRETASRVISYDPNLRLSVEPDVDRWRQAFGAFADAADFIKASDEDIEGLFGKNGEDRFVADCLDRGARLVCITRGSKGASAFSSDESAHAKTPVVKVIDTVGAGDTFQATVLHWLGTQGHVEASAEITGRVDLEAMLGLALKAAAITCSRSGADLPRLADLQAA